MNFSFLPVLLLALLGACAQVQETPAPLRPPVTAAAVSNPAALPSCAEAVQARIAQRRAEVIVSPGETVRGLRLGAECR